MATSSYRYASGEWLGDLSLVEIGYRGEKEMICYLQKLSDDASKKG
jgi:hypothetical protein